MRHSTSTPTKEEAERMSLIKEIGCVVARLRGMEWIRCEVHHLLSGNKRRGHMFTVGLNPWSHRGVPFGGYTAKQCKEMFGPSLAHGSRPFREEIGDDLFLLTVQNALIEKWRDCNGMATD